MHSTIHPHGWSEFPVECFFYLVPLGIVHAAAFVAGIIGIVATSWKRPGLMNQRVRRLGLFLVLLLAAGSVFHGIWSCLIWGRLYHSTDYVFDFTPFWPIMQSVIDRPFGTQRGQLFGVTLTQLNVIWLMFAIGTWSVTVLLYRAILRRGRGFPEAPVRCVQNA